MTYDGQRSVTPVGLGRRALLQAGSKGLAFGVLANVLASVALEPEAALAQATSGNFGPKRKVIWVPQATGDWNIPIRAGQRDFCAMVGWDYQHIGNPVYSVEKPRGAGQQRHQRECRCHRH